VEQAAAQFEQAPKRADAEARHLVAQAEEAKQRADDLGGQLEGADRTTVLTSQSAESLATFWIAVYSTLSDLETTKDALRSLQFTARQRLNASTKLYVICEGDTLESIAASQLGSAARAGDLGLRPSDLIPGRLIRIPTGG
jgi:hypothetical protein